MNLLKDLKFKKSNKTPLYLQIANSLTYNISKGSIKMNEKLPSINVFSKEYKVSRDTVEKAYNVLKDKKIIIGIKGKGVYINRTKLISKINILFLVNKLSAYKLETYHSFLKNIGNEYHTDFEIYNSEKSFCVNLMEKNKMRYDYYVIIPHFKCTNVNQINIKNEALKAIASIPREKLVLLDNNELNIDGDIIEIYQDFENDIYNSLKNGLKKIVNYKRLNLVVPNGKTYTYINKIRCGFIKFCNEYLFNFKILNGIKEDESINSRQLFIIITDDDLVKLLDLTNAKQLTIGKDLGIISYNETPFKRLLDIAVISTNFEKMGETAADMIINNKKGKIKNPYSLIDRNSF
ncbi:regulatory protein, gntR family [Algibacter lectus]|uniref:GntR family transcriptional regulator n=1 Tax=Algibacter lectus TaxID=221126 RepID=UPI0008ECEDB4|nr:GntR family transcriptional regulator [Algibacter lectus]SFB97087.1 regulatory protein, gntR family [Algibacter lectus]